MLRQQRRQRQPSRFNDFVDLPPPQKRTRRTLEENPTSEHHSSRPDVRLGRHTPKVQRSKHVRKMTMDFFKSAAGPDRCGGGGVVTVEPPLCPRLPVERVSTERPGSILDHDDKVHCASPEEQLSPPGSKRAVQYVCPEELESLSGPERIEYLLNKLDQIRIYYASLKTEVASIDRRRKKMKKRERRRRREGSTTLASTSVSPGSSDISGSSPSPDTDTQLL